MNTVKQTLSTINYPLLRKQKALLLKLAAKQPKQPKHQQMLLDGVICLLDEIQDEAALELGDLVVFGKEES